MDIFVWARDCVKQSNINLAFRLEKPLECGEYQLTACAGNAYRVVVGGNLVYHGAARAAHGFARVDCLTVTLEHSAALVIEVAGYNASSYCAANVEPYFCAELSRDGDVVACTDDFVCYLVSDRVQNVQRYSFQRPFAESYVIECCRSVFYAGGTSHFARLATERVQAPTVIPRLAPYPRLERTADCTVIESGRMEQSADCKESGGVADTDPRGSLSDAVARFVYYKDDIASAALSLRAARYFVWRYERTLTGFLSLRFRAHRDSCFYVIYDEIVSDSAQRGDGMNISPCRNGTCSAIRYEVKRGDYSTLTFEPFSGGYFKIICTDGELTFEQIAFIRYENYQAYNLAFSCDDDELSRIMTAAQNTWAQNSVDIFMDCPSRERAGWLCDSFFSARAERLLTGDSLIEKSFLQNYYMSPQSPYLPQGMLPMCYPADHPDGVFIPNWAMWFVIQLHDYYERSGDRQTVELSRHKVMGLLRYFEQFLNEDGLLENLQGWVFIEWSRANEFTKGVNFPSNMLYYKMLTCAAALYDQKALLDQSRALKAAIRRLSFNGKFFADNTEPNCISETCQYYAFFCGIADPTDYAPLFELLISDFGFARDEQLKHPEVCKSNAFIGNYLRLEMLRQNRLYKRLLQECKDFFLYMADRTGTLWEHVDSSASLNHGFASYAANLIFEALS